MSSKPTVIYTAANLPQAHILRNLLDFARPASVPKKGELEERKGIRFGLDLP